MTPEKDCEIFLKNVFVVEVNLLFSLSLKGGSLKKKSQRAAAFSEQNVS